MFIVVILMIIGYLINDIIVIFDRICEYMKKCKLKIFVDFNYIVNLSLQ